jgi:hypothetical protein
VAAEDAVAVIELIEQIYTTFPIRTFPVRRRR